MKKIAITAIVIFAAVAISQSSKHENAKNFIAIRLHAGMIDNRKDIGSAD
jgi:hypothetical protein